MYRGPIYLCIIAWPSITYFYQIKKCVQSIKNAANQEEYMESYSKIKVTLVALK